MDPIFALALAVLGCVTGFAAGLLGIGGGMILVPFLTLLFTWQGLSLELTVHAAIATSMATILFTSVSSVRACFVRHARHAVVLAPEMIFKIDALERITRFAQWLV